MDIAPQTSTAYSDSDKRRLIGSMSAENLILKTLIELGDFSKILELR